MPLFAWHDRFSLGIAGIDEHHQQFVRLVNLIGAEVDTAPEVIPRPLLDALVSLSIFHFRYEERYLADISFPGLADHKKEHDAFVNKVVEAQQNCSDGGTKFLQFLPSWIDLHLNATNARLRLFLLEQISSRQG